MSPERILTTHTGSLPRPPDLVELMLQHDQGQLDDIERLRSRVRAATGDVVRRQADVGIDVLSDGEYGKPSYTGYVKERLSGFNGEPRAPAGNARAKAEFPDWVRENVPRIRYPRCDGPVTLIDPSAARRDIANLKAALDGATFTDVFMSAASPGVIENFMPTTFYENDEEYLRALSNAMQDEYRAIVEAGFCLQVDCPDLAMSRNNRFADLSLAEFKKVARMHIEVLNAALDGLPRERVRLHLCWGNYEGPHHNDVPIEDIIDVVLEARVGSISFEAANPRHAHEWRIWANVELPEGLTLIPGVIDSCTNYIEHPQLVADRLMQFADVVGREHVMAGTDCGFGTSVGPRHVAPSIAWAKLQSMVEGAQLASAQLWR